VNSPITKEVTYFFEKIGQPKMGIGGSIGCVCGAQDNHISQEITLISPMSSTPEIKRGQVRQLALQQTQTTFPALLGMADAAEQEVSLISAVAAVGENNNDELTGLHLASSP
jgi:hypothetical protein